MTGIVKMFKQENGYGFLIPDGGGPDVYFHARQFRGEEIDITRGMPVEFDLGPGRNGTTEAKRVTPIGGEV